MINQRHPTPTARKPTSAPGHSIELSDPTEVETPHGAGIVLYVSVYGVHANDMWCVANKEDGRIRHYETTQLRLAFNGAIGLSRPARR
jgi:hypothetical protein